MIRRIISFGHLAVLDAFGSRAPLYPAYDEVPDGVGLVEVGAMAGVAGFAAAGAAAFFFAAASAAVVSFASTSAASVGEMRR